MKKTQGFTVLEIMIVIVLVAVGSWLFFSEKSRIDAVQRDSARKVAINAMYYNLEEVFYEAHGYYPSTIDSKILRAMDTQLFIDPYDRKLGDAGSNYHYSGKGCSIDGHCTGYELRADLEREDDFIKTNRNH